MPLFLIPIALVGGIGYTTKKIWDHEKRPLTIGSKSIPQEALDHPSFEALVDNYVYVHNAFRNDLTRIIASCESKGRMDANIQKDLEEWTLILDVHSIFEDEVIVVALQTRMKELGISIDEIPQELLGSKDHDSVKDLISKASQCDDDSERLDILHQLSQDLETHLEREEAILVPLLLRCFSLSELRAIGSLIVNPKLDFCDKETLIKITKWWFSNISITEGWPLLQNFIKAGKQSPLPLEKWKEIQDLAPSLQKFPTEDLVKT